MSIERLITNSSNIAIGNGGGKIEVVPNHDSMLMKGGGTGGIKVY